MGKYKCLNDRTHMYFKAGIDYDYNFKPIGCSYTAGQMIKDNPGNWELIKEEPMCTEKTITGYYLIKTEYAKAVELILGVPFNKQTPGLVTVDKCIQDLKKAGVLDLWFEPVYKSKYPDITINGYKGEFLSNSIKFGCAEIGAGIFRELYRLKSGYSNKEIESVTIGRGVFTKDQIKEIAEYYLNK